MARFAALFFVITALAFGHVISMSTGDAVMDGARIEYVLRMPVYEVQKGVDPARALLDRLRFRSNGETAKRVDGECHIDESQGQYLCAADYAFMHVPSGPIDVECTFYEVTAPNHVHMLRAKRDGQFDQAILDSTIPGASLTFRPPTNFEIATAQTASGLYRTLTSPAQLLLLLALALASRNFRETWYLAAAYVLGECLTVVLLARTFWQSSPRFSEASVALAIAYLGVELLAWPQAGGRWLLALLFGAFSGMYFSSFVNESGYRAEYVLSGSVLAGLVVMVLCGLLKQNLVRQTWLKPGWAVVAGRIAAVVLLTTGTVWFLLRLRS